MIGHKVRDDAAQTAHLAADAQAAMEAAQLAQAEGQIIMDNLPAITQTGAALQVRREVSAKPKPTTRPPVFGVQSLPRE